MKRLENIPVPQILIKFYLQDKDVSQEKIIHHRSGSLNIHHASSIDKLQARESKYSCFPNASRDGSHRSCCNTSPLIFFSGLDIIYLQSREMNVSAGATPSFAMS